MTHISREEIDKIWRKIGTLSGEAILRLQQRHLKRQKAITRYIAKQVENFREDAAGVFLYVAHAVLEASEQHTPRPKRVSSTEIEKALAEASAPGYESPEPHLITYAIEAFTEVSDEDDVVLSEHEFDSFLVMINAIALCIHRAVGKR